MEPVTAALRRLDLSEHEQTVYLSLLREGQATARTIAARTGITRPSVYDQLKSLMKLDLVVELDVSGTAEFAAADVKYLEALLADRIDRLEQSRALLEDALPTLRTELQSVTPKIRFFEGEEGVKQLLKDIMWHHNLELTIVWPHTAMSKVFDAAFINWFNERRAARKIPITSYWQHEAAPRATDRLFNLLPQDTRYRLKKGVDMPMATLHYDAKVAHISSAKEAFGFIVESSDYALAQKNILALLRHEATRVH